MQYAQTKFLLKIVLTLFISLDVFIWFIVCSVMAGSVFAVFGTVTRTCEPMVDEYTSLLKMPFVTVDEAFRTPRHKHKIRMLPDISAALGDVVRTHLNWTKVYYLYNSREGRHYESESTN